MNSGVHGIHTDLDSNIYLGPAVNSLNDVSRSKQGLNQTRISDLASESKFDTVYRKDKNPSIEARHQDLSTIMLPDHILTNWTPDEILDAYLILNGYQKTDSSSNRQSEFIGQNKGQ